MAPMVINGGVGGFEQSFHHPKAGQSAHNSSAQEEQRNRSEGASQKNGKEDLLKAVNNIVGLLDEDKKIGRAQGHRKIRENIARQLHAKGARKQRRQCTHYEARSEERYRNRFTKPTKPLFRGDIADNTQLGRGNSANNEQRGSIAAQGYRSSPTNQGAGNCRNRTPQQIIQAVNTATGGSNAVATRTMLSGDVIIIFGVMRTLGPRIQLG
jgi:hypothetical protein